MNGDTESKKITLPSLFKHFFILSTFSFGGGSAIISMIKERFADRLKWVSNDEITDMLAIAQTAPGATTINVSVALAFRLKGIRGAITAVAASILPPLIAIIAIHEALSFREGSAVMVHALHGVKSAAAAIIFTVVIRMIVELVQKKNLFQISLLVLFFIAAHCFNVSVILLLASGVVLGIVITLLQTKQKTGEDI